MQETKEMVDEAKCKKVFSALRDFDMGLSDNKKEEMLVKLLATTLERKEIIINGSIHHANKNIMKYFLNVIVIMLLVTWALSFLVFNIGNVAHAILVIAMLVVLLRIIWAGFSTD